MTSKRIIALILILLLGLLTAIFLQHQLASSSHSLVSIQFSLSATSTPSAQVQPPQPQATATATAQTILDPISGGKSRITKKPFGLYVSPGDSPISPEKFTGYHTGVDFETYPSEQNIDVPISAVCSGRLLLKKWATGYGGVAVQSCSLSGQAVTVIYGHLNVDSITPKVGAVLVAGDFLANLGQGYSEQTDGERKHLHLGIHKGTVISILGYVPQQSQLSAWLDPQPFLK